ncbi:MAG: TonB family protein [bacterium]
MGGEIKIRILLFVSVSVFLHALLFAALPKNFSGPNDRVAGTVTVTVRSQKAAEQRLAQPKPEVKPPEPKPAPESKPVVTQKKPEPLKNQEKPRTVQPAAAPAMLPESAVTSRGADSEANTPSVPVGKGNDTGGTGFTDSKGTSREIRRIETGEAPSAAPAPPPVQRKVEVEKTAPPKPPANVDLNAVRMAYARAVRERIESLKEYPQGARRRGQEGVASVQFTLNRNGSVSGVSIAKTSGYDSLDNAALDAVRKAAPFQPIPKELDRDEFALRVSIVFKLNQE